MNANGNIGTENGENVLRINGRWTKPEGNHKKPVYRNHMNDIVKDMVASDSLEDFLKLYDYLGINADTVIEVGGQRKGTVAELYDYLTRDREDFFRSPVREGAVSVHESYKNAVSAMRGGKRLDEDIGDFLIKKAMDKRKDFVKTHMDSGLFNPMKNAMKSIMKGNYQDAVAKMQRYDITLNSAAPTGIKIFGKRYEKIPFGIAAVAYPISNAKVADPGKRVAAAGNTIREMFINDIQKMMSLKASECHKYQDILSFVLTEGGKSAKGMVTTETQASIISVVKTLMESGWNPGNMLQSMPGFVDYIMRGDAFEVVKFLYGEAHKLQLSPNMVGTYGIKQGTKLYDYITKNGPHKFELHEPDVVKDNSGNITGGTFAQMMSKIGYDVTNKSEHAVALNNLWVIQEQLGIIIKRYQSEGEKISNISEINIFAGSTFAAAKAEIKKITAEYKKLVDSPEWAKLDQGGKEGRLDVFSQRFMMSITNLTKSVNTCLKACGLPPIKIAFKTDITGGLDANKFMGVMRELGVASRLEQGSVPQKTAQKPVAKPQQQKPTQKAAPQKAAPQKTAAPNGNTAPNTAPTK